MTEAHPAGSIALRAGGLALLAGILWALYGISGAALVAAVGVVWILVETPYTVAAGELLYAVGVAEAGTVGIIGAVSFAILFIPEFVRQWRPKTARLAVVALLVASAALAASTLTLVDSLPLTTAILCLGYGVVAYGVHRYESVRFGVVEPHNE